MIGASNRIWLLLSLVGLLIGYADAQQTSPPAAPNPYLMGSEGYDKGPRGLTSFQPIAIDQPFAARMAPVPPAKPAVQRDHQALLEDRGAPRSGGRDGAGQAAAGGCTRQAAIGREMGTARGA